MYKDGSMSELLHADKNNEKQMERIRVISINIKQALRKVHDDDLLLLVD